MGVWQLRRVACVRDTVNARADLAVMQGLQKFFCCVDVLCTGSSEGVLFFKPKGVMMLIVCSALNLKESLRISGRAIQSSLSCASMRRAQL